LLPNVLLWAGISNLLPDRRLLYGGRSFLLWRLLFGLSMLQGR